VPLPKGSAPALPLKILLLWRARLLPCRKNFAIWRARLPACRKFFGRSGTKLEGNAPALPNLFKFFGRSGTKLEGCSPEQPNLLKISVVHDPPVNNKIFGKTGGLLS